MVFCRALAWQLYISDDCTFHLRQRLLHPPDLPAGALYQIISLTPVRSHHPDFLGGPEGIAQQPVGVQLHQPLTLLYVALTARKVLRVPCIHQVHFQTSFFENIEYRNLVDTGGLHRDSPNPALL
jgi:hypothetical protein